MKNPTTNIEVYESVPKNETYLKPADLRSRVDIFSKLNLISGDMPLREIERYIYPQLSDEEMQIFFEFVCKVAHERGYVTYS